MRCTRRKPSYDRVINDGTFCRIKFLYLRIRVYSLIFYDGEKTRIPSFLLLVLFPSDPRIRSASTPYQKTSYALPTLRYAVQPTRSFRRPTRRPLFHINIITICKISVFISYVTPRIDASPPTGTNFTSYHVVSNISTHTHARV